MNYYQSFFFTELKPFLCVCVLLSDSYGVNQCNIDAIIDAIIHIKLCLHFASALRNVIKCFNGVTIIQILHIG